MRRKYLSLDPDMDIGELSSSLADGWKAALPSVRRQFEEMAEQDDHRYREDVRKAKLSSLIQTPQKTITDFWGVHTQLRRMVAPLTPEARARRPRRNTAHLSLRGLKEKVEALEAGAGAAVPSPSALQVVGPLESHQAWVVLQPPQLLLVNPLRLSETSTLARLLATYHFPRRPLADALVLTGATLGAARFSTLSQLPRDGSRVTDERLLANGFCVEMAGEAARVTAMLDSISCYGVGDLVEVLTKIAAGATTLTQSRPARAVSWLQAEAVRISQGDGARMSAEEVATLIADADDLGAACFHGRPLAAPLYRLET
ncbi:uncharacterized protein LOC119091859 [Pollicipes pollicipes]|uniref:uncharacterized protein LOC119091859 n=1 Tax=Pollicipes pollicipes TaxID=41117 RepID=UPI00188535E5|nr:uncharacterized protein LOC119091859 [Pollicipes pollicipes]